MPIILLKIKVLLILKENSSKIENKLFQLCAISHNTRVSLRYFVSYCRILKNFLKSAPSNLSKNESLTHTVDFGIGSAFF